MKAMTIRVPNELHEAIRRVAFERYISMNQLIEDLLAEALTQQGES